MKIIFVLLLLIVPLELSATEIQTLGGSNDQKTHIKVEAHPSDAFVTFLRHDNGDSIRGSSKTLFHLPHGYYQIMVSSRGYISFSKEILVSGAHKSLDIKLEAEFSTLVLSMDPPNAVVRHEGKIVNPSGFAMQVEKSHTVLVSHPNYYPKSIIVTPTEAETIYEDIYLEPKLSTVHYEIHPRGALLEIDGEEQSNSRIPISVAPGKRHIKISMTDYFDYEEVIMVEANRIYPLKVVKLDSNSEDISPSDKKISGRFEYNPISFMGTHGRASLIPFALHLESRYLSLGVGFNQITDEREWTDDNNLIQKETKDYFDSYATIRLISPRVLENYKFYISGTYGSILTQMKNTSLEVKSQKTLIYQGYGIGVRGYASPRWSWHLEHYQVQTIDEELNHGSKNSRTIMGLGYEF